MAFKSLGSEYKSNTGVMRTAAPGNVFIQDTATGKILERPTSDVSFSEMDFSGTEYAPIQSYLPMLEELQSQTRLGTSAPYSFELPDIGEFRGSAEESVGSFFDKDLDLLKRSLDVSRKQAEENKTISERRTGEQEQYYYNTEDISFGRALEAAQSGFSGRGTFTSGFRNKAIGQQIQEREIGLEEAGRQFAGQREDISTNWGQFLENLGLKEEEGKLGIERQREAATLQEQQRMQQEELLRRLSEKETKGGILQEALA